MATRPCDPFVKWAQHYHADISCLNGRTASKSAKAWIRSFGIVAGRIHRYLELGHSRAQILPNSLVLDIVELQESHYAQFPVGDPRRVLIDTWSGLAHVYGTDNSRGDREMGRLDLVADWAHALTALSGIGFPGLGVMMARYRHERQRLDLTHLRKNEHDFKYVGLVLELIKLYERLITPSSAMAPHHPASPPTPTITRKAPHRPANRQPAVTLPRQPGCPDTTTRAASHTSPGLESPGYSVPDHSERVKQSLARLENELYGNWRDDWRNTLPELP